VRDILEGLNIVFESRIRLAIMSLLMIREEMDFNSMKDQLEVTDGNLSSHIAMLEKNRFVNVRKAFVGKVPRTTYSTTREGRKAFEGHLDALEKIIKKNK